MAKREKSRRVALDRNSVPRVACFVRAKTPLGVGLRELLAALQEFVDVHFAPVWGVSCRLVATKGFVKGAWAMAFLDDSDQASASAYHDLTPEGLPLAKVFVRTIRAHGEEVSVAASHELAEMLVDPAMNLMSTGPDPRLMYCYETADPVESASFRVRGVAMSDFVHPAWFETFRKRGSTRFDHLGKVTRPFQMLKGGYQIVFRNGAWKNLHGSLAKRRALEREDRRQHRGEMRVRAATGGLRRSGSSPATGSSRPPRS
jgi:hypothetical protein